jgi:hypothetical protein
MEPKLIVIYTTEQVAHAELLEQLLEEHEIKAARIIDAPDQSEFGPHVHLRRVIHVAVDGDDAPEAIALAESLHAQLAALGPLQPDAVAELHGEPVDGWPLCPRCQNRRTAVCPICETAGTDFPPADQPPVASDADEPASWLCSICDEPLYDRYLRQCEWCGWDFGSGVEWEQPVALTQNDIRLAFGILGLAAVVFALLAYFAVLVSK